MAKGYYGARKNVWTVAKNAVEKGLQYAYVGRKLRKRQFRSLWIQRINAGARQHGMSYSVFMGKLSKSGIELNRKVLADLAQTEPHSFAAVVATVRAHDPYLSAQSSKPAGPLDGLEASRYRWFYDQRGGADDEELEDPPVAAVGET